MNALCAMCASHLLEKKLFPDQIDQFQLSKECDLDSVKTFGES